MTFLSEYVCSYFIYVMYHQRYEISSENHLAVMALSFSSPVPAEPLTLRNLLSCQQFCLRLSVSVLLYPTTTHHYRSASLLFPTEHRGWVVYSPALFWGVPGSKLGLEIYPDCGFSWSNCKVKSLLLPEKTAANHEKSQAGLSSSGPRYEPSTKPEY